MTVRKMIRWLKSMPQDARVLVLGECKFGPELQGDYIPFRASGCHVLLGKDRDEISEGDEPQYLFLGECEP